MKHVLCANCVTGLCSATPIQYPCISLFHNVLFVLPRLIRAVLVAYSKSDHEGSVDIFKLSLTSRTDIANG